MYTYLTEAFKEMELIDVEQEKEDKEVEPNQSFSFDAEGLGELKSFLDTDEVDDSELIIDLEADTEEELKDSYIGDVILSCPVCTSKIYKSVEDVKLNPEAEDELANVGEACPYCQSEDGFMIIGQVAPFEEHPEEPSEETDDSDDTDQPEDETNDETKELDEAMKLSDRIKARRKKAMTEDFKNVSIETDDTKMEMTSDDNGKVTVTTEPITNNSDGEMIAPVSDETVTEIEQANTEEPATETEQTDIEEPATSETSDIAPEGEEVDVEIDELDENEFDELGESYLKKVYENIEAYKTTSGKIKGDKLILEGMIIFKSGKKAKTNFMFEAKEMTKSGKVKFIGENMQISKNRKAFTITGSLDGKKLITESLTYNYRGKDAKTGVSERLYGTVSRRK